MNYRLLLINKNVYFLKKQTKSYSKYFNQLQSKIFFILCFAKKILSIFNVMHSYYYTSYAINIV